MTAAEVDALAKMAYLAHGAFTLPFEDLPAAERERWRAAVRAVVRSGAPMARVKP